MFSRRRVLQVGVLGYLGAVGRLRAEERPLPNILWLVSEDNNRFIGAYGDKVAHTPAIDSLARRGLLYRNAFANAPVCSVSRFTILTGRYAQRHGAAQNHRSLIKPSSALKSYSQLLRDRGYYCTNNAKTDYNIDASPCLYWDESSSQAHWRNRPANKPFMAVFNFGASHESSIFQPAAGRVKYEDVRVPAYLPDTSVVRHDIAAYYNRIEIMDREVGFRLQELEDAGLEDNTIIFYFSDHGGILPRSKRFCSEEGLHVPLIVAVPGPYADLAPARPGNEIDEIVTFVDLAPTVLSIAGAKATGMDGTPFLGRFSAMRPRYAFGMRSRMDERIDFIRTVTDGRFRYVRNYFPHRAAALHDSFTWQMASWREWERAFLDNSLSHAQARFFRPKPYEELYDVQRDPDEMGNLACVPEFEALRRRLSAVLDAHMLKINDQGFVAEGSIFERDGYASDPARYPLSRIMQIAADGAQRKIEKVQEFERNLGSENEVVRFWSAQGLLMLGQVAARAAPTLKRILSRDNSNSVRIIAAEALAGLGQAPIATTILCDILDDDPSVAVKLRSLNTLDAIGSAAIDALPTLRRWANVEMQVTDGNNWTVRSFASFVADKIAGDYSTATDYLAWTVGKESSLPTTCTAAK